MVGFEFSVVISKDALVKRKKKARMRRVCASPEPVCHRVFDQVRFALLIQRWSTRSFFTLAFLILPLPLSQSGADAGGSTISVQPLNTCTRFVPRSRRWISVEPRVAAFRAAPRGCRLAKTWLVSLPPFIRTKYFLSPMRLHLCFSRLSNGP